jgi:hypothetical protein
VEQKYPSQNQNIYVPGFSPKYSTMVYGAETWILNTQQVNKLLATEMYFWRSARKSSKEKSEMAPLEGSWGWKEYFRTN